MPYKDPAIRAAHQKAYILTRRAVTQAFMAEVQARTSCAKCGAQPVEFHSEAHLTNPTDRVTRRLTDEHDQDQDGNNRCTSGERF